MLILIQARMNSKRLPNKVLLKISNKEILSHIISRIKKCYNNVNIIVARDRLIQENKNRISLILPNDIDKATVHNLVVNNILKFYI